MVDIKNIGYTPNIDEIAAVINNPLFQKLCRHLESEYHALCKIEFSKDVWLTGWNVKFKKAGKTLCTVYPKDGFFTVLVVIGQKEKERFDNVFPLLCPTLQQLYLNTREGLGQRWLMVDVTEDGEVYRDVLELIRIRRESR